MKYNLNKLNYKMFLKGVRKIRFFDANKILKTAVYCCK